jgi:hypothetical protein
MIELSSSDRLALKQAAEKLETQNFLMEIASALGVPLETVLNFIPKAAHGRLEIVVKRALEECLRIALRLDTADSPGNPRKNIHTAATAVTGAVGGFFGVPGFMVELPITTTLMLHSIIEIARSHGENLSVPENALACLEIFALGPDRSHTELINGSYYATRAALTRATREAAARIVRDSLTKESSRSVLAFLSKITARFGIEVSEKFAAQAVPIAGAAGGATVNLLFTRHFQRLAEGHFTVRKLERTYGAEIIEAEYEKVRPVRTQK